MNKIIICLLSLVVIGMSCSNSQAGSIYFTGDVGQTFGDYAGTINVVIDLERSHTMQNGGITLTINNDNPSAFQFTDATVLNPGSRWTIASDVTTPGQIQFYAASVLSPALPAGGQGVVFATINWVRLLDYRRSNLTFDLVAETFVNGDDGDVTSQYRGVNYYLWNSPEPGSIVMASIGLVSFILRRRND